MFTHPEHQLLVNITARSPRGLLARGLPPDSTLFLRVYASTAKGRSRSVTFEGYTLRMAEKQTGENLLFLSPLRRETQIHPHDRAPKRDGKVGLRTWKVDGFWFSSVCGVLIELYRA